LEKIRKTAKLKSGPRAKTQASTDQLAKEKPEEFALERRLLFYAFKKGVRERHCLL